MLFKLFYNIGKRVGVRVFKVLQCYAVNYCKVQLRLVFRVGPPNAFKVVSQQVGNNNPALLHFFTKQLLYPWVKA